MPSFNGVNIFGIAVKMNTEVNPVAKQQSAYAGLNGTEELTMGQRGMFTTVTGRLAAPNAYLLGQLEAVFFSYQDDTEYVLTDTLGRSWGNVKLESFSPEPGVVTSLGTGYASKRYTARFFHTLINPLI